MAIIENLLYCWVPALILLLLIVGAGCALLPTKVLSLSGPWPLALASAVGWHLGALLLMVLGVWFSYGVVSLLVGFWLPLMVLALLAFTRGSIHSVYRSSLRQVTHGKWYGECSGLLLMICMFSVIVSVIAATPPTKHDDLHYHLLLAHRAIIENHLPYYPTPYLLSAPHISYQLFYVPLLSIALPEATGVFSLLWAFLTSIILLERLLYTTSIRACIGVAVFMISLHSAVWWTTSNPTAISNLWGLLLFLLIYDRQAGQFLQQLSPITYTILVGLLSSILFLCKVSFLIPITFVVLVIIWNESQKLSFSSVLLTFGITCLFTAGPWLIYAYCMTGNILGFAGAPLTGTRIFDDEMLIRTLNASREANQTGPVTVFSICSLIYSWGISTLLYRDIHPLQFLLAWVVGMFVLVYQRLWGLLFVILGSSLGLAWIVPHATRFHLFSLNALLIVALLDIPKAWFKSISTTTITVVVVLVSCPGVAVTCYYSLPCWPIFTGLQSRQDYLSTRTGTFTVWQWCNEHTAFDARFCVQLGLQPRLFYLNRLALSPEGITKQESNRQQSLVDYMTEYHLQYLITEHPKSNKHGFHLIKRFDDVIIEAYRTPGRKPLRGTIWIYSFQPPASKSS